MSPPPQGKTRNGNTTVSSENKSHNSGAPGGVKKIPNEGKQKSSANNKTMNVAAAGGATIVQNQSNRQYKPSHKSTTTTAAAAATTSDCSMSSSVPRGLAQEAVNWYMQELDPYETHFTNVRFLFRPIVLALTFSIMEPATSTSTTTTATTITTTSSKRWMDYMDAVMEQNNNTYGGTQEQHFPPPSSPASTTTTEKKPPSSSSAAAAIDLPTLDPRTMARLEAFLNGVLLAVPSAAPPTSTQSAQKYTTTTTTNKNNPKKYNHSISLLDGLAGFNKTAPAAAASLFRSLSAGTGPRNRPGGSNGGATAVSSSSNMNGTTSTTSGHNNSSSSRSFSGSSELEHVQIRPLDLQLRLELYLRTLFRVIKPVVTSSSTLSSSSPSQQQQQQQQPPKLYTHCVLAAEPPRALKARAEAIARAFSDTVGTVRQQGPVLTKLLSSMTMELLAVPCLSEGCKKAIRRVVVDYEHQTSFASLAFLSTPEDAADQKLVPLLYRYFLTLQQEWQSSVRDCELEAMLQTVLDPEMRHFFKTVEFASIGHLLETCASYRSLLQHIELPPKHSAFGPTTITTAGSGGIIDDSALEDEGQIRQAIRDLQRERITINGNLLPPVQSRSELLRILSHTLNFAMLSPPEKLPPSPLGGFRSPRSSRGRRSGGGSGSKRDIRRSESAPSLVSKANSSRSLSNKNNNSSKGTEDTEDDVLFGTGVGGGSMEEGDGASSAISGASTRSRAIDMSTVDRLTKRLLLAASRTGTGGDAYFIVSDLFGGQDVQVLASPDLRGAGGIPTRTLEIWLHLGSITIQCHTSFDVYPRMTSSSATSSASSSLSSIDPYSIVDCCEPLIQLHTTTTEVIALQEIRAADAQKNHNMAGSGLIQNDPIIAAALSSSSAESITSTLPSKKNLEDDVIVNDDDDELDNSQNGDDDDDNYNDKGGPYVLQERITSKTGWKTLSIRPALYEKLQVWTTPS